MAAASAVYFQLKNRQADDITQGLSILYIVIDLIAEEIWRFNDLKVWNQELCLVLK